MCKLCYFMSNQRALQCMRSYAVDGLNCDVQVTAEQYDDAVRLLGGMAFFWKTIQDPVTRRGLVDVYLSQAGPSIISNKEEHKRLTVYAISDGALEIAANTFGLPRR